MYCSRACKQRLRGPADAARCRERYAEEPDYRERRKRLARETYERRRRRGWTRATPGSNAWAVMQLEQMGVRR